jgi:hypothetical protein
MTPRPGQLLLASAVLLLACARTVEKDPDAAPGTPDAASGVDAGSTIDAAPPADAPPDIDAPPTPGTGQYLDRCDAHGDCQSLLCAPDIGGSRFCTKSCTNHAQCAHEHFCVDEICWPDDTGSPCTVANPDVCALYCLQSGDGSGECTRPCTSAAECPAGYACTIAGGSTDKLCVNIEKPCADGNACGTGLCITGSPAVGCTAFCDTVADCPARLTAIGLPAYTCANAYGSSQPVCVVPDDVIGSDPIGATCAAVGDVYCRSGICDTDEPTGPMCTQACTVEGGCGPGLGCFPLADGGQFHLICNRGGAGDLGDPCTGGVSCLSGLCDSTGVCTRFCNDGLCPTGWTCLPVAGTSFAICRP